MVDFVRETTSTLLRYVWNQAASQKSKLHTGLRCCQILLEYIPTVTSTTWTRLGYISAPFQTSHLVSVGMTVKGERSLKDRIKVSLCVNMEGDFEKPLVIGRAAVPRCTKNVKELPVTWKHSKKSWMNSHIFTEWVTEFNHKMKRAGRQVLLLLDNAPPPHTQRIYLQIQPP